VSVWPSGEPLVWPGDVPTDARREETFVIVLADRRGDLSSLATTTATRGHDDRFEVASLLQGTQAMTRAVAPEAARPLRYRIEEASFFLTPP
jgi:hypothetical protein